MTATVGSTGPRQRTQGRRLPSAHGLGPWRATLLDIAARFELQARPEWFDQIRYALSRNDERHAQRLCEYLRPALINDRLFPDPFRSSETDLGWRIRPWHEARRERARPAPRRPPAERVLRRARRRGQEHCFHRTRCCVAGNSGVPALAIDPKGDYVCLAPHIDVVPCRRIRINPLCPMSTSIPLEEHIHWVAGAILPRRTSSCSAGAFSTVAHSISFTTRSTATAAGLIGTGGRCTFPTTRDLHEDPDKPRIRQARPCRMGKAKPLRNHRQDRRPAPLARAHSRLRTRLRLRAALCDQRRVVSLTVDGLSAEHVTFLTIVLLSGYYNHFRSCGPARRPQHPRRGR